MNFLQYIIPSRFHYPLSNVKRIFIGYNTYSQCGEDAVLQELFDGKIDGFYVEVGAHHPRRYSNTYLLHAKGWRGVNIDPDANAIALFDKERPGDKNINTGIANRVDIMEYFCFSDPAVNSFVEKEAQRWMKKKWITFLGVKEVPVQPLAQVLEDNVGNTFIDMLSVDTEGMGLEVLQSNDWRRWKPSVIVVEDDVHEYLSSRGYKHFRTAGLSDIYVHKSFVTSKAEKHTHE